MAEYLENSVQSVALNSPVVFNNSISCRRGNVFHEDGTGIFTLCGKTNNCFARYEILFGANIAIAEGGAVTPIATAIAVNGEPRLTSRGIYTPAAAETYGNVSGSAIVDVPKGCCFSVSVRYVSGTDDPTVTPTPLINVQNANLVINRIA